MYASLEVKPNKKERRYRDPIFDSISRSARDSYILRNTKETVVVSNYYPKEEMVQKSPPSQLMAKGEF